jgi:hypothetical protein
LPISPPLYEVSSAEASTRTAPRGFVRKSYHSSVKSQTAGRWLVVGVPCEAGPEQFAVVRPVVLGAGRRVHSDEAATRLDVRGEVLPARGRQDVPAGGEEDDGGVWTEARVEDRGVFRRVDGEAVRGPERAHGRDAVRDRLVAVGRGAGVDEDTGFEDTGFEDTRSEVLRCHGIRLYFPGGAIPGVCGKPEIFGSAGRFDRRARAGGSVK